MMLRRDSKVEEDVVHAFRCGHIFFLFKPKGLYQKVGIMAECIPIRSETEMDQSVELPIK